MRNNFIIPIGKGLLLATFFIVGYTECYTQELKPATSKSVNNIVMLSPYEAVTYINNYRGNFCKRNNRKHTRSIFIPSVYFNFIGDYFRHHSPKDADGVRVFFASYHRILTGTPPVHQAHKKQITLILAPTKDKTAYLDSFKSYAGRSLVKFGTDTSLNHGELCPNSCDITTNPEMATATIIESGIDPASLFFLEPDTAKRYIRNYRNRYCRLRNKKHTKSIWIPRENFEFLDDFFQGDTISKYAGIRVFFASYNKIIKETYNVRKKQITLIFTAALNNRTHEPDFSCLLNFQEQRELMFLRAKDKKAFKVIEKNENHGELCPNACNNEVSDPL